MAELKFEITEKLGVLSENAKGWTKEINLVSWNEHDPKYDIREWAPDHSRMGKGVTLTADELASLKEILAEIDLDSFEVIKKPDFYSPVFLLYISAENWNNNKCFYFFGNASCLSKRKIFFSDKCIFTSVFVNIISITDSGRRSIFSWCTEIPTGSKII